MVETKAAYEKAGNLPNNFSENVTKMIGEGQKLADARETLFAQVRARETHAAENARVAALTETLRLARIRYENGLSSQLEVLDDSAAGAP